MNALERSPDDYDGPAATLERIDRNGAFRLIMRNEGHTLGNLLSARMMRQGHVSFAGYRVPHPLEPVVHVKFVLEQKKSIMLSYEFDASEKKKLSTPKEVVACASHDLMRELAEIESDFQDSLNNFRFQSNCSDPVDHGHSGVD